MKKGKYQLFITQIPKIIEKEIPHSGIEYYNMQTFDF